MQACFSNLEKITFDNSQTWISVAWSDWQNCLWGTASAQLQSCSPQPVWVKSVASSRGKMYRSSFSQKRALVWLVSVRWICVTYRRMYKTVVNIARRYIFLFHMCFGDGRRRSRHSCKISCQFKCCFWVLGVTSTDLSRSGSVCPRCFSLIFSCCTWSVLMHVLVACAPARQSHKAWGLTGLLGEVTCEEKGYRPPAKLEFGRLRLQTKSGQCACLYR